MIKRIITVSVAALALLQFSSCRKFLDVNDNPNVARVVTPALLLPNAQLNIGSALGVDLQINGSFWSQYWTQNYTSNQYREFDQYASTAADYDRVWSILYSGALEDLKQMDSLATKASLKQYQAIARLLKAYTFQVITDGWGDVPFTQALQGDPESGNILSPAYDKQEEIYNGLLAMVDEGMALIDPNDENHPGADDLIYGGDMELWQHFGNTLKLKLLMRLSERNPGLAQQGIQALENSGAVFIDVDEDAQINYISTPGNQNPLYAEIVGLGNVVNIVASSTVGDSLNANDDPRSTVFFATATTVNGIRQGIINLPQGTPVTQPGAAVGAQVNSASATAPVKFITSYESLLLQSEAAARGWSGGDAQQLFEDGITANFLAYGLDATDAADYIANSYWGAYPASGTTQQKIRHIITQKWFCMTGNQGFESWTEWRRTGYPDFFVYSSSGRTSGVFPQRLIYPNGEISTNAKFPGLQLITSKVWWDVN